MWDCPRGWGTMNSQMGWVVGTGILTKYNKLVLGSKLLLKDSVNIFRFTGHMVSVTTA